MRTDHPITPPPELIEDWIEITKPLPQRPPNPNELVTLAARWGADQELEACIQYFHEYDPSWGEDSELIAGLRSTRRPKPPSLKELNLKHLEAMERDGHYLPEIIADLRRAIESLPN